MISLLRLSLLGNVLALFSTLCIADDRPSHAEFVLGKEANRAAAYAGVLESQRLYGSLLNRDPLATPAEVLEGLHWIMVAAEGGDGVSQNLVRQMEDYDPTQMKVARASYGFFKDALPDALRAKLPEKPVAPTFSNTELGAHELTLWGAAASARIRKFWRRPIGSPDQFRCVLRVTQNSLGHVLSVAVEKGSGDEALDLSVVRAAQTASPLPRLPVGVPFDGSLLITFCPSQSACE